MIDLSTRYLGLTLKNPLVCASSPLCQNLDNLRRMEDAGAAAVVLPSLFEEQIETDSADVRRSLMLGTALYGEAVGDVPDMTAYNTGSDGYLDVVSRAKKSLAIPVIGSLNGATPGGWLRYAELIESAGADALELNVYDLPTDPEESSAAVEERLVELVRTVCREVHIPVAVKLSPYFTAPANLARQLAAAAADGLVLFNRFYQPDLDLERLGVAAHLRLSSPEELPLRLHWVMILYGQVRADLAVTGGVHSARDVVKAVAAGASVAQIASVLYKHGIEHLADMLKDLKAWLEAREYTSVRQIHGSLSLCWGDDSVAQVRANYMRLLRTGAAWVARKG
jgi:dihydroorotate dehydrogenase (fumarate)